MGRQRDGQTLGKGEQVGTLTGKNLAGDARGVSRRSNGVLRRCPPGPLHVDARGVAKKYYRQCTLRWIEFPGRAHRKCLMAAPMAVCEP